MKIDELLKQMGLNIDETQLTQYQQNSQQAQNQQDLTNYWTDNQGVTRYYGKYSPGVQVNPNQVPQPVKPSEPTLPTGKILYKKMSLFDAPKNSILVHACNAQGVWGSGIAKEFKSLFPKAFEEYNKYCTMNLPYHTVGTALVTKPENTHRVGCLITSSDFGARLNAEKLILDNTKHALNKLVEVCNETVYYSNKFNSGFFKVPWEKTEALINEFVKKHNKTWVVCDPDLKETK